MSNQSISQRQISCRRFFGIGALAGLGVATGFGGSILWAQQAVRQFENQTVIPLTPWSVNTYLVRGERPILIDTGFPQDVAAITTGLAANGIQPQDLVRNVRCLSRHIIRWPSAKAASQAVGSKCTS